MKNHNYYVYILTRERNSVFYVGVTNNLVRRVYEHKEGKISGFTKKHNVKMLVYYEHFNDIQAAICREKAIKKWKTRKAQTPNKHPGECNILFIDSGGVFFGATPAFLIWRCVHTLA